MKAIIFAILTALCWSIGELFTKQVLHTGRVGPLTAITVRSTVALPALWLVYWFFVHLHGLEPRNWLQAGSSTLARLVMGSGLVAGALGMIFFYSALHLGPISRIKPVAFTLVPALAVLLGWLVLAEPMTARKAVGLLVIVVGVALLTFE